MPKVFNIKDYYPPEAVYIGRPSEYGNPYEISAEVSREECLLRYIDYLRNNPELVEKMKKDLVNKDLVCFCKPKACHGDIILRFVNPVKLGSMMIEDDVLFKE